MPDVHHDERTLGLGSTPTAERRSWRPRPAEWGIWYAGCAEFLGIPFAKPPPGDLTDSPTRVQLIHLSRNATAPSSQTAVGIAAEYYK